MSKSIFNIFGAFLAGLLFASLPASAEIVDPSGNILPDSADIGDIDQSKTKISDLKTRIAPGYASVSNAAMNAATAAQVAGKQDKLPYPTNQVPWAVIADKPVIPTVPTKVSEFENDAGYVTETDVSSTYATKEENAAKQDKLPYPTNAIPQGAVSGLSTALDGKVEKSDFNTATNDILSLVVPLQFAQYYPDGSVKSAAEFRDDIKYNFDAATRTATVKPFCNTGDSDNDNSSLVGRVVIPPFVDAQGNPYISDDGTKFKVVGVSGGNSNNGNLNLTAIVAPSTVTTIENSAFEVCTSLTSVTLPAVTTIGDYAFVFCDALSSVDFVDTPRSSVPSLGADAFNGVPTACKIIVPDSLYDAWIAAPNWSTLYAAGYKFLKHSEWEYARRYELTTAIAAAATASTNYTDKAIAGKVSTNDFNTATNLFVKKSGDTMTGSLSLPSLTVPDISEGDIKIENGKIKHYDWGYLGWLTYSLPDESGKFALKSDISSQVAAAVTTSTNYTNTAISQIPPPDFTSNNATLVATIEENAPAPGNYAAVSNAAMTVYEGVTNLVLAGYGYPFTGWTNDHPDLGLTAPVYIGFKNGSLVVYQWKYEATNNVGTVVGGPYLIPATADGADALQLTTTLNATNIVFSRQGTPIYTNALGLATNDNLKQYVKHTELDSTLEDYVSNETLEKYDASYKIVEGICDENQTIQVVVNESTTVSPLEIQLPTNGRCKDWIVYVIAATNMPLVLPPADYWVRNESITNAIAAGTPTALYFSQVSTNSIFTIGRQEYIPIQVSATRESKIKETMRKLATATAKPTRPALRSFNRPVAKPTSTTATKTAAKPTATATKK